MAQNSRGLALPTGRQSSYIVEMEDGFLMRVPEGKVESWQRADHNAPLNKAEQRLKDRILDELYGSKK